MLRVTTEHQQSRAALAGGALAGLLESMGRGWLGARQGRLPVLWQHGRGEPRALQNCAAEVKTQDRNGAGTKRVELEMHSLFCRHKWQHAVSLSIFHFYAKVHIHPKKQETHIQAPHGKGTGAMPDIKTIC